MRLSVRPSFAGLLAMAPLAATASLVSIACSSSSGDDATQIVVSPGSDAANGGFTPVDPGDANEPGDSNCLCAIDTPTGKANLSCGLTACVGGISYTCDATAHGSAGGPCDVGSDDASVDGAPPDGSAPSEGGPSGDATSPTDATPPPVDAPADAPAALTPGITANIDGTTVTWGGATTMVTGAFHGVIGTDPDDASYGGFNVYFPAFAVGSYTCTTGSGAEGDLAIGDDTSYSTTHVDGSSCSMSISEVTASYVVGTIASMTLENSTGDSIALSGSFVAQIE